MVRLVGAGSYSLVPCATSRANCDPMESDQRSGFLCGRIFYDEPVSTSSENAFGRAEIYFKSVSLT